VAESGGSSARKRPATKAAPKKAAAKQSARATTGTKAAPNKAAAKGPAPATATKEATPQKSPAGARGSRLNAARDLARSAPMSKYFSNARARARKMLDDPEALKRVADESYRSGASRSGPFASVMDDFRTLVRLVVAYARGN
jgi:hypothetical protein